MSDKGNDKHQRALMQAFDTPWPGPTGIPVMLENEQIKLCVVPQDGARITSLQAFGAEVLRQWHSERRAFQYGCFPMVPWVGRLGYSTLRVGDETYILPANKPPHALHGMACYSSWDIVSQTSETLILRCHPGAPWPWKCEILQTIALAENTVALRLEIHAIGDSFPASAGWHPWFNKKLGQGNELRVSFSPDWQEEAGNDELPSGNRVSPQPGPWDDCFGFEQGIHATLSWPGRLRMEMTSGSQSLVIFDKQPDATCVNPMTQAPNAINKTPQFVHPEKPLVIESFWTFIAENAE
ncbi:aldose epimerase [[Enterobacter] lignolyticus]|uniref:Aldose 1-epimerase n=1 Tax=Enterobacter lignolyticus (strain SCF1) TaxID=701347 RepID=E3G8N5_ENTLS|nr:aldose epimerase [[Enterobacter] lignolyticus]ADO47513.1 Aldose 1-epimerase [[Enterobacter] lignolyticus SCF1]